MGRPRKTTRLQEEIRATEVRYRSLLAGWELEQQHGSVAYWSGAYLRGKGGHRPTWMRDRAAEAADPETP
jgi:hypothetical protein